MICFRATAVLWVALILPTQSAEDATGPWNLSAAGSLSAADGNSESLDYSLQLKADYSGELYDLLLGLDYFYAEDDTQVSSNSFKMHEQWTRKLDESWYVGQYASLLHDDVADLAYRIDTSLLMGRHLLAGERAKLSLELGPGYAWEKKGAESDHFMTARLGQRLEFQFNDDTRLWQSFGWTPRVEESSDGIFDMELGLENRLQGNLSLRAFVRHRVDTAPAVASGRSDTALMLGLKYDFTGEEEGATGPDAGSALIGRALGIPGGWVTTAALGVSLNQGNSDSAGIKFDWSSDYSDDERELAWELGYHLAEDNGRSSTDQLQTRLQANRFLDEANYLGMGMGFLRDDLAGIEYRLTPYLLYGRSLVRNERTRLALETGPILRIEKSGSGADEYLSWRVAERFKHQFNERVSLKQSVEAIAALEDTELFLLISKIALDTKLTDTLSWRWELESRYENRPASGRDHHDLLLTSAIAVTF